MEDDRFTNATLEKVVSVWGEPGRYSVVNRLMEELEKYNFSSSADQNKVRSELINKVITMPQIYHMNITILSLVLYHEYLYGDDDIKEDFIAKIIDKLDVLFESEDKGANLNIKLTSIKTNMIRYQFFVKNHNSSEDLDEDLVDYIENQMQDEDEDEGVDEGGDLDIDSINFI